MQLSVFQSKAWLRREVHRRRHRRGHLPEGFLDPREKCSRGARGASCAEAAVQQVVPHLPRPRQLAQGIDRLRALREIYELLRAADAEPFWRGGNERRRRDQRRVGPSRAASRTAAPRRPGRRPARTRRPSGRTRTCTRERSRPPPEGADVEAAKEKEVASTAARTSSEARSSRQISSRRRPWRRRGHGRLTNAAPRRRGGGSAPAAADQKRRQVARSRRQLERVQLGVGQRTSVHRRSVKSKPAFAAFGALRGGGVRLVVVRPEGI